jgi:threonylcarbamoyladenosine tRNA methylthiotransferase MtaB
MDDVVLKRMKRRHARQDGFDVVARARAVRPDTVFGADLIAGFPTETRSMFENTLAAVGELDLAYLHVFPYSPRPGTPAARMPQVDAKARKDRAGRLRTAGDAGLKRFLESRTGTTAQVLVEKDGDGQSRGLSQHYASVRLDFSAPIGAIVDAQVTAAGDDYLIASKAA